MYDTAMGLFNTLYSRIVTLPFVVFLFLLCVFRLDAQNGCSCTNCPQYMPDWFQGDFPVQVSLAANPLLGQNGQGVCGVTLNIDHEYIGDLRITLTSPAGQTVTLIGPIGHFGYTDGTTWNISFVPCGEQANPDPGFSDIWNNNQPWGTNNYYFGSYYPQLGCLEDFNVGSVNGEWTLTVFDGQGNDVGNLLDWSIIFCDPTNILCLACEANAGNLLQPDVTACQGAPNLSLNLPPAYTPPNTPPPAGLYAYKYVIGDAGAGGVILEYTDNPDLSAYPAGVYTICGMSYLIQQESQIPAPDGTLTVQQLAAQLNSATPPFCAKITSNCVNVTILEVQTSFEDYETICAPGCVDYYGKTFCASGDHVVNLSQNGCPYTATLHLTVLPRAFSTVNEIICSGACAQTPGFEDVCASGQYIRTFTGSNGCDSIVTLNLNVIGVAAAIEPPQPISCVQPTSALLGTGSTPPGTGITYQWTAANGGTFSGPTNQINATAASTGTYTLRVCRTTSGATCCDTASVTLPAGQLPPPRPDTIFGQTQVCPGQTLPWSTPAVPGITHYAWTIPPGVTLNNGQGTTAINLTWDIDSAGVICVSLENTCGTGVPYCLVVDPADSIGMPSTLQGDTIVCVGDTVQYTTAGSAGATGYLWELPPNAALLNSQPSDTLLIVWTAPGNAQPICVRAIGACDTSAAVCQAIQINDVPAEPALSGPDSLCPGSSAVYRVALQPDAGSYWWSVTGGIILGKNDSTEIQVQWDSMAPAGTVCVQALNYCGTGSNQCLNVVFTPYPIADAGPDQSVCASQTSLGATLLPGSSGLWRFVDGPGTCIFADSTAPQTSAGVSMHGTYHFQWTESAGLCSDGDTVEVQFFEAPVAGPATALCDPANEFYTVEIQIANGLPPYTVNGSPVAGNLFISAPLPSGAVYQFAISDANGCTAPLLTGQHQCDCSTFSGVMPPDTLKRCAGDSVQVQPVAAAVLDANDIAVFVLHTGAGSTLGQIFEQNTSGVFSLRPGMAPDSVYYISQMAGTNAGGQPDPSDPCLSVSAGQPVIFYSYPQVYAGDDRSVCGNTTALSGAPASGMWLVFGAPAGENLVLADAQAANTLATASGPGIFSLSWTYAANGCAASDTLVLEFFEQPAITGLTTTCDAANENYVLSFTVNGGTAPYSVDGNVLAGNMFSSAPISSGMPYIYTVTDANNCVSPPVSGAFSCSCATNAGSMPGVLLTVCAGDSVSASSNGDYVLDGNDTIVYVLHSGSGAVLGQVFAQNHTGIFGLAPGMTTGVQYFISLVAGNVQNGVPAPTDPCFSVAPGQPVMFVSVPAPDAGQPSQVCGQTATLAATADPGNNGFWALITGPAAVSIADSLLPITGVTASQPGQYVFSWTESNGACSIADTVSVSFFDVPIIQDVARLCNGTNTAYTLQLSVAGGTSPYMVSGITGSFAGNNFVSDELLNGSSYTGIITDANGCSTAPITGTHHCLCVTNAGTMNAAPAVFCAGQPAQGVWNNDATLDADDGVQFVLHTLPGNMLGNILGISDQPAFNFAPPLQTGITYYISAVAGNSLGGVLDFNDPCLSVAAGNPVSWKPLPSATISGDQSICAGQQAVLQVSATGVYPVSVTWSGGAGNQSQTLVTDQLPVLIPVSPADTTVYHLLQATDGSLPTCSISLYDSVTVAVKKRRLSGTAVAPLTYCEGAGQVVDLKTLLTGAGPGGTWSEVSQIPSGAGAFQAVQGIFNTSGQMPGAYIFQYKIGGQTPCPDDSTAVQVVLFPSPVADAGPDQVLSCAEPETKLGGAGTSSGAGIQYNWNLAGNNLPVGSTPTVSVSLPGTYFLTVKTAAGCSAHDSVLVQEDNQPLSVGATVQPVLCFGQRNGSIRIDTVSGGTAPLLFSLNGGPFSHATQYTNLAPGAYTLSLQDVAGCEWEGVYVVAEPPEIKIELGNNLEVALGDSVHLLLQSSQNAADLASIVWRPLMDSTAAGKPYQHFLPLQSVLVSVEVADSNGCQAMDEVFIRLQKNRRVYIPNVFEPASIRNALFDISVGNDVEKIEKMEIFNRWGEKVFEARNYLPVPGKTGWNGTFRGKAVDAGVYLYYLVVRFKNGEEEIFSGGITLLR